MRWRILQIRESCTKNSSMLPENIKHLEMIENVITRLSNIQTTLKGWLVTLLVAFMTLSKTLGGVHTPDKKIVISAILIFWYLDSTYLYKELMFRELYEEVRKKPDEPSDFAMKINYPRSTRFARRARAAFKPFMITFYIAVALLCLLFFL